jgi:hypothetical protein
MVHNFQGQLGKFNKIIITISGIMHKTKSLNCIIIKETCKGIIFVRSNPFTVHLSAKIINVEWQTKIYTDMWNEIFHHDLLPLIV